MQRTTIFRSRVLLTLAALLAVGRPALAQANVPETYTVKAGDTLREIAKTVFGDGHRWTEIYELNRKAINNSHWIYPGQVLRIRAEGSSKIVAKAEAPAQPQVEAKAPAEVKARPKAEANAPPAGLVHVDTPEEEQAVDTTPLFPRRRSMDAGEALRSYRVQVYRPLRRTEFYSSGFLTEGQSLPFGEFLGDVTPSQIHVMSLVSTSQLSSKVAVSPPAGAEYRIGDSLLVARLVDGREAWGNIVVPTGVIQIIAKNNNQFLGTVVSMFEAMRTGQVVLPMEKFSPGGTRRAEPVKDGVIAHVITSREPRELFLPQFILFLDAGRKQGVSQGDIFEIRRDVHARLGVADTDAELIATVQIVHVGERTATAKILTIVSPDLPKTAIARQVAKLPS